MTEPLSSAPNLLNGLRPHLEALINLFFRVARYHTKFPYHGFEHVSDARKAILKLCENFNATMPPHLIPGIISNVVLIMTTGMEEMPVWLAERSEKMAKNELSYYSMVDYLEYVVWALGREMVAPYLILISKELLNGDWRERSAALASLSVYGECECSTRSLPILMRLVIRSLADSHPRVRYYACSLLTSLIANFNLKNDASLDAMEVLLPNLETEQPRVSLMSINTLRDLLKECPERIVTNNYDNVKTLLMNINHTKKDEHSDEQFKLLRNAAFCAILTLGDKT
ncbi:hypothetical protein PENTCL1PPCAC_25971, partial [Pristionchus entomophagus]